MVDCKFSNVFKFSLLWDSVWSNKEAQENITIESQNSHVLHKKIPKLKTQPFQVQNSILRSYKPLIPQNLKHPCHLSEVGFLNVLPSDTQQFGESAK